MMRYDEENQRFRSSLDFLIQDSNKKLKKNEELRLFMNHYGAAVIAS